MYAIDREGNIYRFIGELSPECKKEIKDAQIITKTSLIYE